MSFPPLDLVRQIRIRDCRTCQESIPNFRIRWNGHLRLTFSSLCLKRIVRILPSGWFTLNHPSVQQTGAAIPWWESCVCHFMRYRLLVKLPLSRQRCVFSMYPCFSKSAMARLTVERESPRSDAIVFIPGQHFPFEAAMFLRYMYTVLARCGRLLSA